jgi:type III restriction enzyme
VKLHFEANLDYQQAATASVVDLFRGQEICRTEFTVTAQSAVPLLEAGSARPTVAGTMGDGRW